MQWAFKLLVAVQALATVVGKGIDANHYGLDTLPSRYLVQFPGEPGSASGIEASKKFYTQLQTLRVPYTITHNYTTLLNAAALTIDGQYIDSLGSLTNAKGTYALRTASVDDDAVGPTEHLTRPPMPMISHNYTGVDRAHSELKLTGQGIKVGILDTGIDLTHPAFGNCFKTAGCPIQYGYDFVGDDFNGTNTPKPGPKPIDNCTPHGTHVAGVVAGNHGVFKGVAPKATLGIYRIMGCEQLTSTEVVLQALEMAYTDGMQVINMSFGVPSGWSLWAEDLAVSALMAKGVYVVAGAGNDGDNTLWAISSPATGELSLAVGAAEIPEYYSLYLNVTANGTTTILSRSDQQRYLPAVNFLNVPVIRGFGASGSDDDDLACEELAVPAKGAVVVVRRGVCDMQTKASFVQKAGGILMIVYNNSTSPLGTPAYDSDTMTLPSFSVENEAGTTLINLLRTGQNATMSVDTSMRVCKNSAVGQPSWYSSWGPAPEGYIKPDLLAPGTNIYSTVPVNMGSYNLLTGTSMATPYVAGAIALMLESNRRGSQQQLLNSFVNTATLLYSSPGVPYSPAQQGNGLINVYNALTATTSMDRFINIATGYLTNMDKNFHKTIELTNHGNTPVTYNFEFLSSAAYSAFTKDKEAAIPPRPAKKYLDSFFHQKKMSANPGSSILNSVAIDPRAFDADQRMVVGGFINVYPAKGTVGVNLTIPFLGYAFEPENVPMLASSYNDIPLPCMSRRSTSEIIPKSGVFTMVGDDFPVIIYRLQAPVARVRVRITKASDPSHIHAAVTENFFSYLSKAMPSGQPYITYAWDGRGYHYNTPSKIIDLPNGSYHLLLSFYMTMNVTNPNTYTSPVITIKRPKKNV
ncbi:hypothetical protein IWQ60_008665 [Tieghemiomyces parasiticus]|uniref:Peptidase S8/S53 domain-containing protein n=1 Tax=Tieghemiomyces parasiticus TaxID=78921 RepID=A0A9W7ZRV2_9FUNG|nr:hypothetical protein IWQ60_008665 [Tieghemiomyces parasiticus]